MLSQMLRREDSMALALIKGSGIQGLPNEKRVLIDNKSSMYRSLREAAKEIWADLWLTNYK